LTGFSPPAAFSEVLRFASDSVPASLGLSQSHHTFAQELYDLGSYGLAADHLSHSLVVVAAILKKDPKAASLKGFVIIISLYSFPLPQTTFSLTYLASGKELATHAASLGKDLLHMCTYVIRKLSASSLTTLANQGLKVLSQAFLQRNIRVQQTFRGMSDQNISSPWQHTPFD